MFLPPAKRAVKAPRLPRNSPQLHHKNTATLHHFSQKPLHPPPLTVISPENQFVAGLYTFLAVAPTEPKLVRRKHSYHLRGIAAIVRRWSADDALVLTLRLNL